MSKHPNPNAEAPSPRVTVVIPCYNYGHFLPLAVDSALSQKGVDVDVIIVDDCSTDGSAQVAQDLASREPRVRTILHDPNQGHIRTYNHGLSEASGTYVVLLSADDLLAPGSLRRSTRLMETRPSVGLVYGYAAVFESEPPQPSSSRETWTVWTGMQWIEHMCRSGYNFISSPEVILRRSVMSELVGYRADMPHAADMELWLRAAAITDVGRINGPDQAYYRVHSENMHLTDYAGAVHDTRARRDVFHSLHTIDTLPAGFRTWAVDLAMRTMAKDLALEARRSWRRGTAADRDLGDRLAEQAVECDSGIISRATWALWRLERSRELPRIVAAVDNAVDRAVWFIRWRRSRWSLRRSSWA